MRIQGLVPLLRPWLLGTTLTAVLLASAAPSARAHGGQFRPPGAPAPTGPGMGPVPVPQVITPGETWQTWWDLNRLGLIPGRDEALRRQVITPGEGEAESLEAGWARRRALAAEQTVVPYLLRLVDPKGRHRDEVVAAALIALGKISSSQAALPLILHWLRDRRAKDEVRESAALALGLLRRSEPSLQLPGEVLDDLREALLDALGNRKAPLRLRTFAALALGLLGDQPFGTAYTKDGRMVVHALWQSLAAMPKRADLPTAVFVALGLQPRAGCSDSVREGLRQIALGKAVHGRRWIPLERSHAAMAIFRQGGPNAIALLVRTLRRANEHVHLRRAAYIALGRMAPDLSAEERRQAASALEDSLKNRRDPQTTGLGLIAAGRLLGEDLGAGRIDVLEAAELSTLLLDAVRSGTSTECGFGALGLAQAAVGARASGLARPLLEQTRSILLRGLTEGRGPDILKASYAAGLGMLDVEEAIPALLDVVRDGNGGAHLRGHAAVALGQMGRQKDEVVPALVELLREKRGTLLRVRAATGLALLGGRLARTSLLEELRDARSEIHQAHVVIALGRLGDLQAVAPLLAHAEAKDLGELPRALAVVALGLLTDPEPRPSILRLTQDANYPAAPPILYSAYAIF